MLIRTGQKTSSGYYQALICKYNCRGTWRDTDRTSTHLGLSELTVCTPIAIMVYDWGGDKQELCYRLYITEGKSLEEVMDCLKQEQDFAPRYVEHYLFPVLYPLWWTRRPSNGNSTICGHAAYFLEHFDLRGSKLQR